MLPTFFNIFYIAGDLSLFLKNDKTFVWVLWPHFIVLEYEKKKFFSEQTAQSGSMQ